MMMNYHLENKYSKKRKRTFWYVFIFVVIILFILLIWTPSFLGGISHTIAKPIWAVGGYVSDIYGNFGTIFSSKTEMKEENEKLKKQILSLEFDLMRLETLQTQNQELKNLLNRKDKNLELIAGRVISFPPQTPYGTTIIDIGEKEGVSLGSRVFGLEGLLLGRVSQVFGGTSNVELISKGGVETPVEIGSNRVKTVIYGRGLGNFFTEISRESKIEEGDAVFLEGTDFVVGIVVSIESSEEESFNSIFIKSPIWLNEIYWIGVEK